MLKNIESSQSSLYVFVDGPKDCKDSYKVNEVQKYVLSIDGFKSLDYFFSDHNKGLGPSVIEGVSKILDQYKKAIVLEDDLVVSKNFLAFMNSSLSFYENNKKVFSVCGYSNKIKVTKEYQYDGYICTRSSSWGWGTWVDRWNSVDWNLEEWSSVRKKKNQFNKWGGSDCYKLLNMWKKGNNQSWAIRFCYSQFLQSAVSIFPLLSKVRNYGFDGQGTNCKRWNRFKSDFDLSEEKTFKFPETTQIMPYFLRQSKSYHSIFNRLISRLMYLIYP